VRRVRYYRCVRCAKESAFILLCASSARCAHDILFARCRRYDADSAHVRPTTNDPPTTCRAQQPRGDHVCRFDAMMLPRRRHAPHGSRTRSFVARLMLPRRVHNADMHRPAAGATTTVLLSFYAVPRTSTRRAMRQRGARSSRYASRRQYHVVATFTPPHRRRKDCSRAKLRREVQDAPQCMRARCEKRKTTNAPSDTDPIPRMQQCSVVACAVRLTKREVRQVRQRRSAHMRHSRGGEHMVAARAPPRFRAGGAPVRFLRSLFTR